MSDLVRFDVESHDQKAAVCIETEKGYWTPWYIAQRRINELRSSRDEYRSNHERLVEALRDMVELDDCSSPRMYIAAKNNAMDLLDQLEAEKGGEL